MQTASRRRLSRSQIVARRNLDWLFDHEQGRPDPVTGRCDPRSVALIAALARTTEQTVRNGIAAARLAMGAVDNAGRAQ
jgi:hypothetical protein